jgi:hypothetical protein
LFHSAGALEGFILPGHIHVVRYIHIRGAIIIVYYITTNQPILLLGMGFVNQRSMWESHYSIRLLKGGIVFYVFVCAHFLPICHGTNARPPFLQIHSLVAHGRRSFWQDLSHPPCSPLDQVGWLKSWVSRLPGISRPTLPRMEPIAGCTLNSESGLKPIHTVNVHWDGTELPWGYAIY